MDWWVETLAAAYISVRMPMLARGSCAPLQKLLEDLFKDPLEDLFTSVVGTGHGTVQMLYWAKIFPARKEWLLRSPKMRDFVWRRGLLHDPLKPKTGRVLETDFDQIDFVCE